MVDVTNYWPDPKGVSSDQTTILAHNYFYNPSPVGSYDGYLATGTATLSQPAGRSIKGAGGIRVTSPDASSGVALTLFEYDNRRDNTVAVYVRASSAMTITASVTVTGYTISTFNTKIGWGEYGWGEPYSYTESASYTFAAGEVKRVRIGSYLSTNPTGAAQHRYHLKGAGTFDIDGVMHVGYQTDGVHPSNYPGGVYDIANVQPYFDGDKTDTAHLTYSWDGTANASRSTQRGNRARYLQGRELAAAGYNNCRTSALPSGETGVAMQAPWEWHTGSSAYPLGYGVDLRSLGLTTGKHYVLSMDAVSLYENYIEGQPGHLYDSIYAGNNAGSTYPHPMRKRLHQPLTVGSTAITEHYLTVYRGWMTGESFFTDFSLFEVAFRAPTWSPNGVAAALPLDLLAHGLVAGSSYRVQFSNTYLDTADKFYRIEYQTAAGGSTWSTLYENVYDAAVQGSYFVGDITVPSAATALRLTANTTSQLSFDFDVFSIPPDSFSGDTPDGGGYTYSWSGTPYQSASVRSEAAAGPTAQVFVSGSSTGIAVSEMRVVVSGGSLVPVTEAG